MIHYCYLVLPILILLSGSHVHAADKVGPVPEALKKEWKLSDYYQKCILSDGLPILSSDKVSDFALLEAHYVIDSMLKGRDDVRKSIVASRVRLAIMSVNEFTLDIPEHSDLKPKEYWNRRARGLGATRVRPAVSCGEENLLDYPGDPYHTESIMVHEFAHVVHQQGLAKVDRKFQEKLQACYDAAKEGGLWKGTYAISNPAEYWAEAVQSWFHCNRTNDAQHNDINSREQLKKYDPRVVKLLEEAFPDNNWLYVKPSKRKELAHLQGFDKSKAPRFRWPEAMEREYNEYLKNQKKKP
ncbi:MAG: hypothetical protein R3B84_12550 [Zavarzinella sp.]